MLLQLKMFLFYIWHHKCYLRCEGKEATLRIKVYSLIICTDKQIMYQAYFLFLSKKKNVNTNEYCESN